MKIVAERLRARWRSLEPHQRDLVEAAMVAFAVCTGCAALGYWCGWRDGRRG